jgi:hypothetical protein
MSRVSSDKGAQLTPPSAQGQTQQGRVMQPGEQHPDEWRGDLNPNRLAGQNVGPAGSEREKTARSAYDVKDLHNRLHGFPDDLLKQIPILAPGTRLQQGATYVDLNDPNAQEFTAAGFMEANPDQYLVPKDEVDYQLWNRLLDIRTPERVGDPGPSGT